MCGIIGFCGKEDSSNILVEGIKRLEYRGYDSVGFACFSSDGIIIEKSTGKIHEIEKSGRLENLKGNTGIAHCRWATHGGVSERNAHPHTDCSGNIAVVHNGIIENYSSLKDDLISKGHVFKSDTDTEVISHLIEEKIRSENLSMKDAIISSLKMIEGSYALGIINKNEPGKIYAARNESPLIVGISEKGNFIASDVPAILKYTNRIVYLDNNEICVLGNDSFEVYDISGSKLDKKVHEVKMDSESIEKGGYPHFMLKEIYEQPKAITKTLNGRVRDGNVNLNLEMSDDELMKINRIIIVACGTSWHAGLAGEFMLEELSKIPVEVEYASEFRYRNPIIDENTLVISISQSGETADTLAAMREAKEKGAKVLCICNVRGSSIARESDAILYTHAGPEIGVASTKAFTTQLIVLYLFTLYMSKLKGTLSEEKVRELVSKLRKIPLQLEQMLSDVEGIKRIARLYSGKSNALYLGRGINFPIALEGALKLKEISYVHAEGYPAAEMKHGPIALIDKEMPVLFVAPKDVYTYKKVLGNIEEVKARGGKVIAVATEGDKEISLKADNVIFIPKNLYTLSSILAVVPLQLLAYYIALERGCDVDKPRNLAKSVTVE